MFETSFRIRSTQVDQLGHLNNAAFLEIFEWARWEWGEQAGSGFQGMIAGRGLGPVVVHADVSFRREVRFHERVRVQTRMESCAHRQGIIHQRMLRADGKLASEARFTFLMMDLAQRRIVPMPKELCAMVEPQPLR